MGSPGLKEPIQLGAVDLNSQNVRTAGVCRQPDGMAALRGCNHTMTVCQGIPSVLQAASADFLTRALESRAPGRYSLKRTARRVFGGAHPTTEMIELQLRYARAALRARETPSSPSPPSRSA